MQEFVAIVQPHPLMARKIAYEAANPGWELDVPDLGEWAWSWEVRCVTGSWTAAAGHAASEEEAQQAADEALGVAREQEALRLEASGAPADEIERARAC
jgi:hypothetical protein